MTNNKGGDFSHKAYITDSELFKPHLAKNQAFTFVPAENSWMLDVHISDTFDLSSLHESRSELKLHYLKLLTKAAKRIAPTTFKNYLLALEGAKYPSSLGELKQQYPRLSQGYQRCLKAIYSKARDAGYTELSLFADFLDEVGIKGGGSKFLDPKKGAYSDKESASLSYAFRVTTDKFLNAYNNCNKMNTPTEINQLGSLVAHHLMRGILRRPTQLANLKWSDFRPVGVRFNESISSPDLSDSDALHVRVFKGKRGNFRGYAEKRSIRLEPELSSLVFLYHHHYLQTFIDILDKQEVSLTRGELTEIRGRLPVFADLSLFSTDYKDKETLFKLLSMNSKTFHKSSTNLGTQLNDFTKAHFKRHLQSERIDNSKLSVSNNRIRHTALTNGARKGCTGAELAALTGVTPGAVRPYVDLTNEARLEIDEAFSDNRILNDFGRIPIVELQSQSGFIQLNEFDEEIAVIANPHNCSSCKSNLGKPLGCYPCPNFKPLAEGNHKYYLDKAERKLALNSESNSSLLPTRKLREVVLYIQATIEACSSWKCKTMDENR